MRQTVSYAFVTHFPSELFEEIFAWILESAVEKGFVKSNTIFIDATHIKADANRNKKYKMLAKATAHVYDEKLREEINAERIVNGKKAFEWQDNGNNLSTAYKRPITKTGFFRSYEYVYNELF